MALMIHCRECAQTWWTYTAHPAQHTKVPYTNDPLRQVTVERCWQHKETEPKR